MSPNGRRGQASLSNFARRRNGAGGLTTLPRYAAVTRDGRERAKAPRSPVEMGTNRIQRLPAAVAHFASLDLRHVGVVVDTSDQRRMLAKYVRHAGREGAIPGPITSAYNPGNADRLDRWWSCRPLLRDPHETGKPLTRNPRHRAQSCRRHVRVRRRLLRR